MEEQERRREKRIQCVLGIAEVNDQSVQGTYLLDISSIGAQMETDFPVMVGDLVKLGISLSEDSHMYHISGQVIWVGQGKAAPERHCIGLCFLTPFSETRKVREYFRYRLV